MKKPSRAAALGGFSLLCALVLAGCAVSSSTPAPATPGAVATPGAIASPGAAAAPGAAATPDAVASPPAGARADYQLGGPFEPAAGVAVVTRDSTAPPAPGLYSICYVNAFQSQPGVEWPAALVVHDASGAPLIDPGWPDESIFDIATAANRAELLARLSPTVSGCSAAGYRAVEFDNLDSYTRSNGAFGADEAIAFATQLVALAHASGLAAGQKNAPDLAERGRTSVGFDFVTAEECVAFEECDAYAAVYGQNVIDIEYDEAAAAAEICANPSRPRSTMVRDRELTTPGAAAFVDVQC